eukprot:1028323-Ditylum_brightwellii.AAC.1
MDIKFYCMGGMIWEKQQAVQSLYWCPVKDVWVDSLSTYIAAMKIADVLQSAWELQQLERLDTGQMSISCVQETYQNHIHMQTQ